MMNRVQATMVDSDRVQINFTVKEINKARCEDISFTIDGSGENLKIMIIRLLAFHEILKEKSLYFKYGPSFDFCRMLETDKGAVISRMRVIDVRPYSIDRTDIRDVKLIAIMHDRLLDELPKGLGKIIKEIEADRENLVKKSIFDLKMSGLTINSLDDIFCETFLKELTEGVKIGHATR